MNIYKYFYICILLCDKIYQKSKSKRKNKIFLFEFLFSWKSSLKNFQIKLDYKIRFQLNTNEI